MFNRYLYFCIKYRKIPLEYRVSDLISSQVFIPALHQKTDWSNRSRSDPVRFVCPSTPFCHSDIFTLYLCLNEFSSQSSYLTSPSFCSLPRTIPGSLSIRSANSLIFVKVNIFPLTNCWYSSGSISRSAANRSAGLLLLPSFFLKRNSIISMNDMAYFMEQRKPECICI